MLTKQQLKAVPILQLLTDPEINAILELVQGSEIMLESRLKNQFDSQMRTARKESADRRSEFENTVVNLILKETGIGYDGANDTPLSYLGRVIYELKVKAENGRL